MNKFIVFLLLLSSSITGVDAQNFSTFFTSPDKYGAVHQTKTFAQAGKDQTYINTNYPGIGATVNDQIDWAALQMAVNEACSKGKGLILKGGELSPYRINRSVMLPKYYVSIVIYGNYAMIQSTDNGSYDLLTRQAPTDNGDANVMINSSRTTIGQLLLKGGLNQIGINLGPMYQGTFVNVNGFGLKTCIHLRFDLQADVSYCNATNCTNGFIADMGNWSGASNSNSQSNHTTFRGCHYYGDGRDINNNVVGVGFAAIASSGVTFLDCIVEGYEVKYGILIDSKGSTVVKNGTITNCHVECINGTPQGSFIHWKPNGGILHVSKVFGQYGGLMIEVDNQTGAYPTVILDEVVWWVPLNVSGVNKFFKSNGCTWQFNYNDNITPGTPQEITNQFDTRNGGIAPVYCPSTTGGCGGNRYGVTYITR